jgi:3-vinyl bacteriochlorophyllide hydratase
MTSSSQGAEKMVEIVKPRASGPPRDGAGVGAMTLRMLESVAPVPWAAAAGSTSCAHRQSTLDSDQSIQRSKPLYTPQQRERRDASKWTLVQGVLAPIQFLVFLVSLALVVRYLSTGTGYGLATASVIAKTGILYLIMITGAIWEKVVFDKWLFAESFFWEDVFSMLVLGLHTAYLAAVFFHIGSPEGQMLLALAAYATYLINAAQFIWKLRMARLEGQTKAANNNESAHISHHEPRQVLATGMGAGR